MKCKFLTKLTINGLLILTTIGASTPIYAESTAALFGSNNKKSCKTASDDIGRDNKSSSNPSRYTDDKYYKSESYKILDEFKEYIRRVPENVYNEIDNYRAQLNSINQRKKEYYNKLSFEAQNYLKKTHEFKTKLAGASRSDNQGDQDTWEDTKENMKDKARGMKENMKDKAQDMKDKAYNMKENIKDKAQDMKDKAYNMKENIKDKAQDVKENIENKMKSSN